MGSSSTGGFGNSFNFPSFPSESANQTPTHFPGGHLPLQHPFGVSSQTSSSNPFGIPSVASPFASTTLGSNPTPHTHAFGFPTPTSTGFANQGNLFGGFTGDGGASKTPTWGSTGAWGTSGAIPPSPFGATGFNTTSPSVGSFGKKPTANFRFPTSLHTNNSGKENPFSASLSSSMPGGSRMATYTASKEDGESFAKLVSISAMPVYDAKSHEELKWEDYQLRIQGGPSSSVIQTPSHDANKAITSPFPYPGSQPTGTPTPSTSLFPFPASQLTGVFAIPLTNPFPFPGSQPTGTSTTPSTNSFPFPASQPTVVFDTPSTNPFPFPGSQPSTTPSTNPFPFPGSQPSTTPSTNPFPFPGSQPSTTPSTNPFPFPGSQPSTTPSTNPFPFPGSQPSTTPSINPFPFPGSQPSTTPSTNPFPFPGSQPSTTPSTNPFPFPGSQPSTTPSTNPFPFPGSQPSTTPSTNPFPFPGSQPSTTPLTNQFPFPGSQPSTTPSTNPFPFPGSQPSTTPSTNPFPFPGSQPSTTNPFPFPGSQPSNTNSFPFPGSQPSTTYPFPFSGSQPSTTNPFPFPGSQPSNTNSFPFPGSQPSTTYPFPFSGSQPSTTPSTSPFPFPGSQPSTTPSTNPFPFPGSQPSTTNPFPFPVSQPSTTYPFPFSGSQPSTTPSTSPFPFPGSQPSTTPSTNPFPFPGSQPSTTHPFPFPVSQPSTTPSTNPFPFPGSQPSTTPSTNPFPFPGSQPSTTSLTNPFPFPGSQPSTTPSTNPFPFLGSQPTGTHHPCTVCGCMKKNDCTSQVQTEFADPAAAEPPTVENIIVPVKDPFGVESSKSQLLAPPKVGISSMPVFHKPSPSRVSPLLTLRHVSQGRTTLQLNIWKPKYDVKKVPFFIREDPHGIPRPVNHPIPRENPKSAFVKVSEPTNDAFNGMPSQLNDVSAEPNENSADETYAHLGLSRNVTVEKQPPAAVPKLTHPEYYTEPLISELEIKEISDPGFCGRVRGFVIGRHGYGKVEFEGETDVRGLDLDSLVEFNPREVAVYKDESKKVAVGEGLNKPALVTLLNVKCLNKKTKEIFVVGDEVAKYTDLLRAAAKRQGAQFVSFDAVNGEWKFRVDHF